MRKKIGMIPAAGRGSRMLSLTDNHPKAMLPFNNKPIIGHLLTWFIENDFDEVIIIVGYQYEKIIDYVTNVFLSNEKIKIQFVRQEKLNGLGEAIELGLNNIDTVNASLLIVLGDIILQDKLNFSFNEDFLLVNEIPDNDFSRWCLAEVDKNGGLKKLHDKPKEKPATNFNLCGVYNFSDIALLKKVFDNFSEERKPKSGEVEFSIFIDEYNEINKMNVYKFTSYLDLGKISDLNKSKLFIVREFNKIELILSDNEFNNYLIKKSSKDKKQKIIDEFEWYKNLPNHLLKYTPEVHKLEVDEIEAAYSMEYIKSTPLQELYMYDLPSVSDWLNIVDNIYTYLNDTKVINTHITTDNLTEANNSILLDKTLERSKETAKLFKNKEFVINGKFYKNPCANIVKIIDHVKKIAKVDNLNNLSYLHGDLFFGNMMYDIENNELKLIDPRGKYGQFNIYGDIRYDLAKLNHSIKGDYDFIANGLYTLRNYNTTLNYTVFNSDNQNYLEGIFIDIVNKLNINIDEVNFITGLLFLTMIPLHNDNKNNQVMQFIKACEFLEEYL